MRVLVNYKLTKETVEEHPIIQIVNSDDVFIDLPLAVAEFGLIYKKPVLFGDYNGIPTIKESNIVKELLSNTEIHHFKIKGERLIEVSDKECDMTIRLPKGTNTDQLIYDNGNIVWVKPVENNHSFEKEADLDGNN